MNGQRLISELTVEEFNALLDQRVYDVSSRIVRESIKPKQWLSGTEAMELLNCRESKLKSLVRDGHILKNRNNQYSRKSIDNFLNKLDNDI